MCGMGGKPLWSYGLSQQFKHPKAQTQTASGGETNSLAPGLAKAGVRVWYGMVRLVRWVSSLSLLKVSHIWIHLQCVLINHRCMHIDASRRVEDRRCRFCLMGRRFFFWSKLSWAVVWLVDMDLRWIDDYPLYSKMDGWSFNRLTTGRSQWLSTAEVMPHICGSFELSLPMSWA